MGLLLFSSAKLSGVLDYQVLDERNSAVQRKYMHNLLITINGNCNLTLVPEWCVVLYALLLHHPCIVERRMYVLYGNVKRWA